MFDATAAHIPEDFPVFTRARSATISRIYHLLATLLVRYVSVLYVRDGRKRRREDILGRSSSVEKRLIGLILGSFTPLQDHLLFAVTIMSSGRDSAIGSSNGSCSPCQAVQELEFWYHSRYALDRMHASILG